MGGVGGGGEGEGPEEQRAWARARRRRLKRLAMPETDGCHAQGRIPARIARSGESGEKSTVKIPAAWSGGVAPISAGQSKRLLEVSGYPGAEGEAARELSAHNGRWESGEVPRAARQPWTSPSSWLRRRGATRAVARSCARSGFW